MKLCLRPALALLVWSVLLLASCAPCLRVQAHSIQKRRSSSLFEHVYEWTRKDQPFLDFISKTVSRSPRHRTSAFLRTAGLLALDGLQTTPTSSTGALFTYRHQLQLIQANASAATDRPLVLAINATLDAARVLIEVDNGSSTARQLATSLLFDALYDYVYRGSIVAAAANVLTASTLHERVQAADAYCRHSATAPQTDACLDSYLSIMFTARQFALTVLKYTRIISNYYCAVRILDEGLQYAYTGVSPEIDPVDTIKTYLTRAINMKDLSTLSTSCLYQAKYSRVCTSCWYTQSRPEDMQTATSQPQHSRGQSLVRWYVLPLALVLLALFAVMLVMALLLARQSRRRAAERNRSNPILEDAAVVAERGCTRRSELRWCIMMMPDGEEVAAIVDTSLHVKETPITTPDVAASNSAFDLPFDRLSMSSPHSQISPHSGEQPVRSSAFVAPVRLPPSNEEQERAQQGNAPIELVFVLQ